MVGGGVRACGTCDTRQCTPGSCDSQQGSPQQLLSVAATGHARVAGKHQCPHEAPNVPILLSHCSSYSPDRRSGIAICQSAGLPAGCSIPFGRTPETKPNMHGECIPSPNSSARSLRHYSSPPLRCRSPSSIAVPDSTRLQGHLEGQQLTAAAHLVRVHQLARCSHLPPTALTAEHRGQRPTLANKTKTSVTVQAAYQETLGGRGEIDVKHGARRGVLQQRLGGVVVKHQHRGHRVVLRTPVRNYPISIQEPASFSEMTDCPTQ